MPEVCIIIPTYDRAALLEQCIKSVLAQSHSDFEIIVVDDGSTDNTREVVAGFSDPRVRYVWQPNQERCVARNNGASQTSAKYLAFLDSDDLWFPHTLTSQIAAFKRNPDVGLVFGPAIRIDGRNEFVYPMDFLSSKGTETVRAMREVLLVRCALPAPSVLVRADMFHEVGGWDESFRGNGEDWDLWIRLSSVTDFCEVGEPLAAYRIHEANSINDLQREFDGGHSIWAKHLREGDSETQRARVLSEILMYARLGVRALSRSLPSADEWLMKAGDMAEACSQRDFLANHIGRYAQDTPRYQIGEIIESSETLASACSKAGLSEYSHQCAKDYWYRFIHGSYQLQDARAALRCVRELVKRCGLNSADRSIRSIAARCIVRLLRGSGRQRRVFPMERDLDQVLDS